MKEQRPLKKLELTLQEIWAATRPSVRKSKKQYTRKKKHKKVDEKFLRVKD